MFRIVSHNACWFQGFPYEALNPDAAHPEVLRRLTAIYRGLAPDVVCNQEVQHAEMAESVARALNASTHYTRGGAYPVYGCATYGERLETVIDGHHGALPPQRSWQICRVTRDDCSVTIANLHLTSDRFLSKVEAANARVADLRALLHVGKPLDVICGDFNEGPRESAALLLEKEGFVDAAAVTGIHLPSTGVGKNRSDQIWVRKKLESAIAGFGAAEWSALTFDAPDKNVLSDHLPLWLALDL